MKVLIAPAHYLFSDKYGSEPLWSVELVDAISHHVNSLDIIVGINECSRQLPENVSIHSVFRSRSPNALVELVKRSLFYFLVSLRGIKLSISKGKYDVVHHMLPFSLSTFNPLLLILKVFSPRIVTVVGPAQIPYSNGGNLDNLDIALTGRKSYGLSKLLLKIIYSFINKIAPLLSKIMLKFTDRLVVTSQVAERYFSNLGRKIVVIPPGISISAIVLEKKLNKSNIKIISVGELTERKGHKFLIEAAITLIKKNRLPIELTIVGEGDQRVALENMVKQSAVEQNIKFTGQLNRNDLFDLYNKSTLFCLPSLYDSFPTVILEAMYFGLPIICSEVGSCGEIIEGNGLLVKPGDVPQLVKAIQEITSDRQKYAAYSGNSRERFNQKYQIHKVAENYLNVYQGRL